MIKEMLIKEYGIMTRIVDYIHTNYLETRSDDIHDLYIEALYELFRIKDEIAKLEGYYE